MSKFKIKMKLTGFELEIEGSRDDMPLITEALARQMSGLLSPPDGLVDANGEEIPLAPPNQTPPEIKATLKPRARNHRATANQKSDTSQDVGGAVNWIHDSTKFGNPDQSWTTAKKALWTLYVAENHAQVKEMTASRIASTFNKHYRQAKTISAANVIRDLGKLKISKQSPVSQDTTKTPAQWFLTQEGQKVVQTLIAESLNS